MALSIVVYEWQAWRGYMLSKLIPEALCIAANPRHRLEEVLDACPANLDAFAFHLNCTRTDRFPECRFELIDTLLTRGVPVLNGHVVDIGKRSLQEVCRYLGLPHTAVTAEVGQPDELLIVKSNLNYGGFGERRMSVADRDFLGIELPPPWMHNHDSYQLLKRHQIPKICWHDTTLAIERFVTNSHQRKHRVYFAGYNCIVSTYSDPDPIKRYREEHTRQDHLVSEQTLAAAEYPALPISLQIATTRLRRQLRMDFGAIDIVEDEDGLCYVVDVNSTTFGRSLSPSHCEYLAHGLTNLIENIRDGVDTGQSVPSGVISLSDYIDSLVAREQDPKPLWTDVPCQVPKLVSLTRRSDVSRPIVQPDSSRNSVVRTVEPATRYSIVNDLCIIICLFNLDGSADKLRNFGLAESIMYWSGLPVYVVECAFGDDPWNLAPHANVFRLRTWGNLWQKERIINCVIRRLPRQYTKVAWVDGDVLFENPDWAVQASEALDTANAVQLCDRIIRLPPGEHCYRGQGDVVETFASVYARAPNELLNGNFATHGHTGIGWAARRELLQDVGLYDACIIGGADHVMAHAFCGDWESPCLERMMRRGSRWHQHAVTWSRRAYPLVRSAVTVINGAALHLWHGELTSRRHMRRYQALLDSDFDPMEDVEFDSSGCWRWKSRKSELARAVAEYMFSRRTETGRP